MAENQDRSTEDLTEEVSPYRLEDYRSKGMVSQSREITGLLAVFGAAVACYALAPRLGAQMADFMRDVFRTDLSSRMDLGGTHILRTTLMKALGVVIAIGLPVCAVGFILGVLGSIAQIGTIFSADPLTPKFEKIDPIQGIKRFFTMRHVFDSVRLVFKTLVVMAVAYAVAKSEVLDSAQYIQGEPAMMFGLYGHAAKVMFLSLFGVLAAFAAMDFGLQRWEYNKQLRLTKEEAKQEHKEREGDPLIKSRIRAIQRDMARKRMMQAVKKADVIITNPTHIAIAISYEKNSMAAPKVVAKGADFLAQKIKKIASDAGVPLVENVPLARTLYKTVKVGQYVPRALYQAVAEVLAYVYRLKNRNL